MCIMYTKGHINTTIDKFQRPHNQNKVLTSITFIYDVLIKKNYNSTIH